MVHQVSWAALDVFQGRWRQRQLLEGGVARFTEPLIVEHTEDFEISKQAPVDQPVAMRQRPDHEQHAAKQQKQTAVHRLVTFSSGAVWRW